LADHFPNARLLPPQGGPRRTQPIAARLHGIGNLSDGRNLRDYPERFVTNAMRKRCGRRRAERHRERAFDTWSGCATGRGFWRAASFVDIYAAMFSRWRGSMERSGLAEGHIPKLGRARARGRAASGHRAGLHRHLLATGSAFLYARARNGGAHGDDKTGRNPAAQVRCCWRTWLDADLGPGRVAAG